MSVVLTFERALSRLATSPVCLVVDDRLGAPLLPDRGEELAALATVAPIRLDDFRRGRACARAAMMKLGHHAEPVLRDDRGPRWPTRIVGSITHCSGLAAAAVAWRNAVSGIGIDSEPRGRVPRNLAPRICTPLELATAISACSSDDGLTLLWCVKEAVFKCVNPISGQFLEFLDITIALDPINSTFTALATSKSAKSIVAPVHGAFAFNKTHTMAGCVALNRVDDARSGSERLRHERTN